MLALHLLIPDIALADAILEQIKIQALGASHADSLPAEAPTQPMVVIVDEAAADAKTIKRLQAIKNAHSLFLLLGTAPDLMPENLLNEIFPKPIRLGHLIARLKFHSEVAPRLRSMLITIGTYRLDLAQRSLVRGEDIIRLTEKETALLEYLAQSPQPVGREELLAGVWGYDARIDTHTLETHIYQLRRKLNGDKKDSELIINENGLYRLCA